MRKQKLFPFLLLASVALPSVGHAQPSEGDLESEVILQSVSPLKEPHLASNITEDEAFVAYMTSGQIHAIYFDGASWTALGQIPGALGADPTVAYIPGPIQQIDPIGGPGGNGPEELGKFVAAWLSGDPAPGGGISRDGSVKVHRFDLSLDPPAFQSGSWPRKAISNVDILFADKPWMVAGEIDPLPNGTIVKELYVLMMDFRKYTYARSGNGGAGWTQGNTGIGDGYFAVQISVPGSAPGTPLYAAYADQNPSLGGLVRWKFKVGTDVSNGAVTFDEVKNANCNAIVLKPKNKSDLNFKSKAPGQFAIKRSPHIVADPSAPSTRFYVLYTDENPVGSNQLDVFCATIEQTSSTNCSGQSLGKWKVQRRRKVNRNGVADAPDHPSADQFVMAAGVDACGGIHVAFYDNRRNLGQAKYDYFYAFSSDQGQSFQNFQLDSGQPPALDFVTYPSFEIGEYQGLAVRRDRVRLVYVGTPETAGSTRVVLRTADLGVQNCP